MQFKGKAWKFGEDVNTDDIIPAKYLDTTDPLEMASHCMEGYTGVENFSAKVKKGDIIVAGRNFGCGSSREHAPVAIKASGVSCVIAPSFARIFFRNSINIGLPILECRDVSEIKEGDRLEVSLEKGLIKDITQDKTYKANPFPVFMSEIIDAGGLMKYVGRKINSKRK